MLIMFALIGLRIVTGTAFKGNIVASCAPLAEGDAADRDDIVFLERLPLFFK